MGILFSHGAETWQPYYVPREKLFYIVSVFFLGEVLHAIVCVCVYVEEVRMKHIAFWQTG